MITAAEKRADTPSVGTRRPQRLGCSFIYSYAAWVTVNDLMSSLCVCISTLGGLTIEELANWRVSM